MPQPKNIDLDRITHAVLSDLHSAVSGWRAGWPLNEVALLSRITEALVSRHQGCDVGLDSPVIVKSELFGLHGRGVSTTDRFGSDLAVTVKPAIGRYAKTAFFQLKTSKLGVVRLERRQLEDASWTQEFADRSFVIAVDAARGSFRVAQVRKLLAQWKGTNRTQQFQTDAWKPIGVWISRWLSCFEAPVSDSASQESVESMLTHLFLIAKLGDISEEFGVAPSDQGGFPFRIARAWNEITFDGETKEIFDPPKIDSE